MGDGDGGNWICVMGIGGTVVVVEWATTEVGGGIGGRPPYPGRPVVGKGGGGSDGERVGGATKGQERRRSSTRSKGEGWRWRKATNGHGGTALDVGQAREELAHLLLEPVDGRR